MSAAPASNGSSGNVVATHPCSATCSERQCAEKSASPCTKATCMSRCGRLQSGADAGAASGAGAGAAHGQKDGAGAGAGASIVGSAAVDGSVAHGRGVSGGGRRERNATSKYGLIDWIENLKLMTLCHNTHKTMIQECKILEKYC